MMMTFLDLINKNKPKYQIKKILKLSSFKLSSSNLRNYYHKNILAFGDLLHRIHPLAGQGFNMTIRDIKILSRIIQNKIELGMQLDSTILAMFEKETKSKNLKGFLFEKHVKTFSILIRNFGSNFNKFLKIIGKNKTLASYFIKLMPHEFLKFIEQLYYQNYHNCKYLIFRQFYFFLPLNFCFLIKSVFLPVKKAKPSLRHL